MRLTIIGTIFLVCLATDSVGQDCTGKLNVTHQILDDSRQLYLKTRNATYELDGNCFVVPKSRRSEFRELPFVFWNRFPPNDAPTAGFLLIQTIKTMKSAQQQSVRVFRNPNWFVATEAASRSQASGTLNTPVNKTIKEWNSAYGTPGSPIDFAQRLGVVWHAYLLPDEDVSSASYDKFWIVPESLDSDRTVVGNNMVRFIPQTSGFGYFLTGYIAKVQRDVSAMEVKFESNIEEFGEQRYQFVFEE